MANGVGRVRTNCSDSASRRTTGGRSCRWSQKYWHKNCQLKKLRRETIPTGTYMCFTGRRFRLELSGSCLLTGHGSDLHHIREAREHLAHAILEQRRHALSLRTRRDVGNPRPLLNQALDLWGRYQQLIQPYPPTIAALGPLLATCLTPDRLVELEIRAIWHPQRIERRRPIGLPQFLVLGRRGMIGRLALLAQRPR